MEAEAAGGRGLCKQRNQVTAPGTASLEWSCLPRGIKETLGGFLCPGEAGTQTSFAAAGVKSVDWSAVTIIIFVCVYINKNQRMECF